MARPIGNGGGLFGSKLDFDEHLDELGFIGIVVQSVPLLYPLDSGVIVGAGTKGRKTASAARRNWEEYKRIVFIAASQTE